VDDMAPLGEPLHGRGHWCGTFPEHTRPPREVKEAGIIRAKQLKHAKAKNENKSREGTKVIIQKPRVVTSVQTVQRITSLTERVKNEGKV